MERVKFSQIIQNRDLLDEMVCYLQSLHAQESFEFWVEVELFRRMKGRKKREETAKHILEKYMKSDSIAEINIDWKMKAEVVESFVSGAWDHTLFDKTQESLLELLKNDCLKGNKFSNYRLLHKNETRLRRSMRSLDLYSNINKYWEITRKEIADQSQGYNSGSETKPKLKATLKRQLSKAMIKLSSISVVSHNNSDANTTNNDVSANWVNAVIYERRSTF